MIDTGHVSVGSGLADTRSQSRGLNDRLTLELVPEVGAVVEEDRAGHHRAAAGVAGLEATLDPALTAAAEYQIVRDDEPAGHATQG